MSLEQLENLRIRGKDVGQDTMPDNGITVRAVVIGLIAIIPGVFWGVYGDVVSQTDLTSMSLMMPPVLILITLLLINSLLRKIKPLWVLSRTELITIYAMLTISVILSGMGMLQFLCTTLGAVPHYKSLGWENYLNMVPPTILPKLSAIDGFYKGNSPIPWSAWTSPILLWSGFLFSMLFCMLCINTILRRQWVERERLTFPIVQLPLEMTEPKTGFFKNKLMWMGFLIAMSLETMNSLNFLFPSVPYIQLKARDLQPYFTTHPWNAIGYFPTTFYPLAIGLGFVLAADVSFSCWFFYILTKLEFVFAAAIGWKAGPGNVLSAPPYLAQQSAGAFFGIVVMVVYLARKHLREVFTKAFRSDSDLDSSQEPMSYKMAVGGLLAGFAVMVAFCMYVGMSPLVAVAYLAIYLMFATTITRLRAEAGPAWTMGPGLDAMDTLVQPLGTGLFSQRNLVSLAYFHWFSIEMRCCPMPVQLESMKMAQSVRQRQRIMTIVVLIAIVAGIAVGFWACLAVWYKFGAGTAKVEPWRTHMGRVPFDRVTAYINNPTKADVSGIMAMAFGAGFTFLLSYLRTKFFWWPFHPAGYVLANTGTMYWLWCPFLLAWLCKVLIIRYGGIKGYRIALPFFLGLVLGDYITSSLWALAGSILGIHMYRCFPC
ncbi:MAG: hypothetical protein QHH26_04785 [Armatimonadota bacterium]|nr:hypothetical protein [Armatimonadota bacterium]